MSGASGGLVIDGRLPAHEPLEMSVDGRVAFAGGIPQGFHIEDVDAPLR
jgi:hypothetical protein